jgi:putative ABC transport system substrate-binding protein
MRRRSVLLFGLVAVVLAPKPTSGQAPKIPRVGFLTAEDSAETATADAFRTGLRDLGYVEGRDIVIEFRVGHGDYSLVKRLAAELVNIPVDVIVTAGGPVAAIALETTNKIPIVTTGVHPPLMAQIGSLARPNVNVTGFTLMAPELVANRLEILRTAFPEISAVAVFTIPPTRERARIGGSPRRRRGRWACRSPRSRPRAPRPYLGFWNRRQDIVALVNGHACPPFTLSENMSMNAA